MGLIGRCEEDSAADGAGSGGDGLGLGGFGGGVFFHVVEPDAGLGLPVAAWEGGGALREEGAGAVAADGGEGLAGGLLDAGLVVVEQWGKEVEDLVGIVVGELGEGVDGGGAEVGGVLGPGEIEADGEGVRLVELGKGADGGDADLVGVGIGAQGGGDGGEG